MERKRAALTRLLSWGDCASPYCPLPRRRIPPRSLRYGQEDRLTARHVRMSKGSFRRGTRPGSMWAGQQALNALWILAPVRTLRGLGVTLQICALFPMEVHLAAQAKHQCGMASEAEFCVAFHFLLPLLRLCHEEKELWDPFHCAYEVCSSADLINVM
ncbi:hypothetical protein BC628DRAFT_971351 [Trametes gibbosa]|nr:hypothetical protein BC628DRAFT_971351 [Trametes gibbosa]